MLNSGTELKGLLKYNTRNGILSYQDGVESKVFTPLRVAGFEFFDERLAKQRIFYTLTYEDHETSVDRPLFFELLKDYKTFVILSKVDRVDIEEKHRSNSIFINGYSGMKSNSYHAQGMDSRLEISQTETIYLMSSSDGKIKPYIKVTIAEDGVKDIFTKKDSKTKNKMIDRDLMEEYVASENYIKLLEYAEHYTLNFKVKSDLMKILDYYDELISK